MKRHVDVSPELRILRPLLERWMKLCVKYVQNWKEGDCPWWYNERAIVGILAAAAWQVGDHALEEYVTDKSGGKGTIRGRGDLYFQIGGKRFVAEAKYTAINVGPRAKPDPVKTGKQLLEVRKSVLDRVNTEDCTRLGLLFISPYYAKHTVEDEAKVTKDCAEFLRKIEADAAAWDFPPEARTMEWEEEFIYPGFALLVKK